METLLKKTLKNDFVRKQENGKALDFIEDKVTLD